MPAYNITDLFTQLGPLAAMARDIYAFQNGTWSTDAQAVLAEYSIGDQALNAFTSAVNTPSGQPGELITAVSSDLSVIQQTVQQVVQSYATAYNPPSFNVSISAAVALLIQQMQVQGQTIKRCNVTMSTEVAPDVVNTGDGVVITSVKRSDGLYQENLYAESTLLSCTQDAQTGGGATAGNESFTWAGTQSATFPFSPAWPAGSGATQSLQVISALYSNSNNNVLVNGTFDTWTNSVPNNWIVQQGTAGTNVLQNETEVYVSGGSSMEWVSNGTLISVAQQFNAPSTGTGASIPAQTQYGFVVWVLLDAVPSQGTLEIALVDKQGNVTDDTAGTPNVCDYNLVEIAMGQPGVSSMSSQALGAPKYFVLDTSSTATQTFVVPADWNNSSNSIECIGISGSVGGSTSAGGGGGGGAYAKTSNLSFTPGQSVSYYNPQNTGQPVWFDSITTVKAAPGGTSTSSGAGGLGGQAAACVGTVTHSGGNGGAGGVTVGLGCGGGGGAGGPNGDGVAGSAFSITTGGNGGAGDAGFGGAGGTGGANGIAGKAGSAGIEMAGGLAGPGGGGGGNGGGVTGAVKGGLYGGGPGGFSGGGAAVPGVIVVTYRPKAALPTVDWTPLTCVFRSPNILPTAFLLRMRLTTGLVGAHLFFDQATMGVMTLLYTGGPSVMIADGAVHFLAGNGYPVSSGPPDSFQLTTTNDRGGASNLATWQTMLYRLLTVGADVLFPSSASPTISDGLI